MLVGTLAFIRLEILQHRPFLQVLEYLASPDQPTVACPFHSNTIEDMLYMHR